MAADEDIIVKIKVETEEAGKSLKGKVQAFSSVIGGLASGFQTAKWSAASASNHITCTNYIIH